MVTKELIAPQSIVVVGASDDVYKPGGRVLENLIQYKYAGKLYAVNPKAEAVQGIKAHKAVEDLPQVDLAIIAVAAKFCPHIVEVLAKQKQTKAFIILSAGFHEENEEGAKLERQVVDIINSGIGINQLDEIFYDFNNIVFSQHTGIHVRVES